MQLLKFVQKTSPLDFSKRTAGVFNLGEEIGIGIWIVNGFKDTIET